jgi:hypothetical protein
MSSLEDRQNELQNRISQIDAAISALDAEFLTLASEFHAEDGVASLKQAEQIEQRLTQLRREKAVVIAAQGHTTREQLREKEAQAAADRRALLATAKQAADGVITLNNEIDEHLIKLRQLFERRAALFREMGNTGCVDSVTINRLGGKGAATRAFCATGLHAYVSVEKVAQGSFVTLASTNVVLMGVGKDTNGVYTGGINSNGGAAPTPRGKVLGAEADEEVT